MSELSPRSMLHDFDEIDCLKLLPGNPDPNLQTSVVDISMLCVCGPDPPLS